MIRIFAILLLFYSLSIAAQNSPITHISEKAMLAKLQSQGDKVVLIDVRTKREYQNGHIPKAINIPHQQILKNSSLLDEYKDKHIVLYCHSGVRVQKVANHLVDSGHQLFHLKGDYRAWRARNGE